MVLNPAGAPARIITVSPSNDKGAFKIRPDCGTNVAVTGKQPKTGRPALQAADLERLALHYVERYATSRVRLRAYLHRKLRERGWAGEAPPPVEQLAERMAQLGYVNDALFAEMRATALTRRGYGSRRVEEALRLAGIEDSDAGAARAVASEGAWDAAMRFASRRRIGPYGASPADEPTRKRQFSAMLRAGHSFEFSKRIVSAAPGDELEEPL